MFAAFALGALMNQRQALAAASAAPGTAESPAARRARSAMPTLVMIFLIVVIGLRYKVGGDWHNYEVAYDVIKDMSLGEALDRMRQEPAFTIINWAGVNLGAGLWFGNLVCAIPFCWGLMKICRQQPNPWLAVLVATPFLIIVVGMGFTRQGAALGFLMAGLADYIETRSLVRFVIYTVAGGLFHRTVVVFVPIVLLAAGRNKVLSVLLALGAAVIGYFTIFTSSMEYYQVGYLNGRFDAAGASVRVLMNVLPALLLLLTRDRLYRSREEKVVWRTFAILSVAAGAALFVVSSSVIVDRLAMYLIPIQMFVLARLSFLSQEPQSDMAWRAFVVAYSAAVLFVWINYGHYSAGWLPYRSYLGGTG